MVRPPRLQDDGRFEADPLDAGQTPSLQIQIQPSAPPREVWATAVSPNGRFQVAVRPGYACELREVTTSRTHDLADHAIACIAFSPGSTVFATGDRAGAVRLWDAASGAERGVLDRFEGAVSSVAWSPVGDLLAAAGEDGVVRVTDLRSPSHST